MKFKLFESEKKLTTNDLKDKGFTKIMRSFYLNQDEVAYDTEINNAKDIKNGTICITVSLEDIKALRIKRRVHHYNLYIVGKNSIPVSFATLPEVREAIAKISDAASKKGYTIPEKTEDMRVNLLEAAPLLDFDACDGCLSMLLWPLFALAYYTILPIANIILRLFIK